MFSFNIRPLKSICTGAVTLVTALGIGSSAVLAEIAGSCEGYFEDPRAVGEILDDGEVTRANPIPVLRDGAEVYATPEDNGQSIRKLTFGDRLFITRFENGYYRVALDTRKDDASSLGWVKGDDLLCRNRPVLSPEGIARKFYVRTKASFVDEEQGAITAKAGPRTDVCAGINGRCRELSRFTLYYVYASDEVSQRVLLQGRPNADADAPLIGWVNLKEGYLWDTRFGLRPKENLVFDNQTGDWEEGEERRACLYETLEDAYQSAGSEKCYVPILGGNRWFNYSLRIPVFERVEYKGKNYFHVAMPTSGVGSDAADDVLSQVQGLDEAIKILQDLGNLDVFFLIDGTQSMQPHINALTGANGESGVLTAIQTAFEEDPRFENVQVRFGYRVFRDTYAGNYGIGEGMPFDANCSPTAEELDLNSQAFEAEIKKIDTQFGTGKARDPDFEENLIMGLAYAADDMANCPDNVKLLFVIGDTGYDLEEQQSRGTPIESEEEVLSYMTQNFSTDVDPIIPFFIQVPRVDKLKKFTGSRLKAYDAAYQKFTDQGKFFAQKIGDHFSNGLKGNSQVNIAEHFYSLEGSTIEDSQEKLVEYILDRVSKFGDQRPINEVIAELQGGTALVKIISALSGNNSIPALRLAQIEKRICEELGKACEERVFNDITEGYIEDNEDIQLDIWIDGEEFRTWRSKLDLVKDTSLLSAKELSNTIVKMMVDGLQNSTGDLSPSEMNMSIAEFLKLKYGLPTGSQTPLLNYTIGDFIYQDDVAESGSRRDLIEVCELYRVARWLERHREIFDALDRSEVPLFSLNDVETCEMRYPTKELAMEGRERFPEDTMGFRQVQMNETIFWIPNKYLP
jgi:hypothetical protein